MVRPVLLLASMLVTAEAGWLSAAVAHAGGHERSPPCSLLASRAITTAAPPAQNLDFDFEKCCSVTLSGHNVYACLVCGKYFQVRCGCWPLSVVFLLPLQCPACCCDCCCCCATDFACCCEVVPAAIAVRRLFAAEALASAAPAVMARAAAGHVCCCLLPLVSRS